MNRLPQLRQNILAALAKHPVVLLICVRPRKLARELGSDLRMCDIKIEKEDRRTGDGVLRITWKVVE